KPPSPCVVKQTRIDRLTGLSPEERAKHHRRFQLEAQQLATLGQHPQIPQLLDVVDNDQGQFLVQEYIPGPNLDQLAQQQPMDEAQIRRILADLLPVLQFVHSHRVIHRDIKPANIIAPPPPQALVLVDFGASKYIYDQALLEKTGTVIGSAGYVAPEQALGKAVFASDIFSLGLTCLHLLTGLHPFDLYSVSDDAWVWQPFVANPVSPALGRVLDRMVNRSLKERYGSAREVMADLRWGGLSWVGPQRGGALPMAAPPGQIALTLPQVTWEQRFVIHLPGVLAHAIALSPNGRALATGCSDGSVRLWDCTNGEAIHTFSKPLFGLGHRGAVNGVVFTPDGSALISGGEDGQVIRWDLADYGRRRLPLAGWLVSALVVTPDGETLAVGTGDGHIHLWPLTQPKPAKTLIHHQDQVMALAVEPEGQVLISGSRDRTIRLWALPSGRLLQTLTEPLAPITALACHPQDGRLVSGDQGGRVQVWSPQDAEVGAVIQQFSSSIRALAISPDGGWLAVGDEDGHLALLNLQWQGQAIQLHHAWAIQAVAFTPDSRMVVSSGADETLRFWCLEEG
ncbi:MAG TPA: serine/threonine protein kinase, partial [Leptolyngbyaceae cyanobacterium M65_K2018_010]|nr:serine/threonine protein kinase [Leptolyngbyaceae cyanobacterium M65_K2018_010]